MKLVAAGPNVFGRTNWVNLIMWLVSLFFSWPDSSASRHFHHSYPNYSFFCAVQDCVNGSVLILLRHRFPALTKAIMPFFVFEGFSAPIAASNRMFLSNILIWWLLQIWLLTWVVNKNVLTVLAKYLVDNRHFSCSFSQAIVWQKPINVEKFTVWINAAVPLQLKPLCFLILEYAHLCVNTLCRWVAVWRWSSLITWTIRYVSQSLL